MPKSLRLSYRHLVPTTFGTTTRTLFDELTRFRQKWPGRGWSWDPRINCVSSSFSTVLESEARTAISGTFRTKYTDKSMSKAPAAVHEIGEATGGLRSDQMIVTSDTVGGLMAYGLWWPWGDDVTISFRVGLIGSRASDFEEDLRELFGATL